MRDEGEGKVRGGEECELWGYCSVRNANMCHLHLVQLSPSSLLCLQLGEVVVVGNQLSDD